MSQTKAQLVQGNTSMAIVADSFSSNTFATGIGSIAGSSSGYMLIKGPPAATYNTLVLPSGNGAANQRLTTNGGDAFNAATLTWGDGITYSTTQNSTSGSAINFPSLPSWIKRITILCRGVKLSGTDNLLVQIGSGSYTATGYIGTSNSTSTTGTLNVNNTTGFPIYLGSSSATFSGTITISTLGSNVWVSSHAGATLTTSTSYGGGDVALAGTLDRLRLIPTGANTFTAGAINITYES